MNEIAHPDFESAMRGAAADVAKQQATSSITNATMGGVGLGLLGGGSYALWRMLRKPDAPSARRTNPSEAVLPVKTASQPEVGMSGVLKGDNALDSSGVWWKGPLALAGGLTAAMGTAGVVRTISDKLASHQRRAKEEEAKAAFESALSKSLAPAAKVASDGEDLGDKLVKLFDLISKRADFQDTMSNILKAYGVYAVGTGLGAGAIAYNSSKNKNRNNLRKAVMMRQASRARSSPTEIILPQSLNQPPVLAGAAE